MRYRMVFLVKPTFAIVLVCLLFQLGQSIIYSEKWGYVTVRPGANLFWWLYHANNVSDERIHTNRPLIIWLQGGPGDSSSGYGNFQEIGPLDVNLQPRNTTWLTKSDLLFIDSPVGAGFSFTDSPLMLTTTLKEITDDLMNFTYVWLEENRQYQIRPSFVFGESYGGKMAVAYAQAIHEHIRMGKLKINLKGVGLGNSWISPPDFVLSWPEFLYYHSWLSPSGLAEARMRSDECHSYTKRQLWANATDCIQQFAKVVSKLTAGVSWYNILKHDKSDAYSKKLLSGNGDSELGALMNGPIKRMLGVIPDRVEWGAQADPVYYALYAEIMQPAVAIVDHLLENTDLHVFIYNGQLDLICNTPEKLCSKERCDQDMFMQHYDRLWFFWVLHAGHSVPADAAEASLNMLDVIFAEVLHKE